MLALAPKYRGLGQRQLMLLKALRRRGPTSLSDLAEATYGSRYRTTRCPEVRRGAGGAWPHRHRTRRPEDHRQARGGGGRVTIARRELVSMLRDLRLSENEQRRLAADLTLLRGVADGDGEREVVLGPRTAGRACPPAGGCSFGGRPEAALMLGPFLDSLSERGPRGLAFVRAEVEEALAGVAAANGDPPWLSVQQSADRLGVSEGSVRKAIERGRLSAHRFERRILLRTEDVDALPTRGR